MLNKIFGVMLLTLPTLACIGGGGCCPPTQPSCTSAPVCGRVSGARPAYVVAPAPAAYVAPSAGTGYAVSPGVGAGYGALGPAYAPAWTPRVGAYAQPQVKFVSQGGFVAPPVGSGIGQYADAQNVAPAVTSTKVVSPAIIPTPEEEAIAADHEQEYDEFSVPSNRNYESNAAYLKPAPIVKSYQPELAAPVSVQNYNNDKLFKHYHV